MSKIPLEDIHIALGAKMVNYAGFNMPVEYSGVIKEHVNVRTKAGLFDVSHMGEFIIQGSEAEKLLQYITTNDISKIFIGKAQYNCLPNKEGGIVDDLIIYRLEDQKYMAIVNAANIQKDWDWFNAHNNFDVRLENISEQKALFALQGPESTKILSELTTEDVSGLGSFQFVTIDVAGCPGVIVAATGYTGSGGFEICCDIEYAKKIWDSILKAGENYGILPIGLAARDTLRLEMGYSLYGNDIDDTTSPLEAGLGWITKLDKPSDFISKEIFVKQKEAGTEKKMIGIEMLERGIPRHGYLLLNATDEEIGVVTSGTQSPVLQKGIGMAYLKTSEAIIGKEIQVAIRNRKLKAKVVKFPFI